MDSDSFLVDVEQKPANLRTFAHWLDHPRPLDLDLTRVRRVVITGLGSSRFAGLDAARELRSHGVAAWCDFSSANLGPLSRDTLLVAISASGCTPETVTAARERGRAQVLALTNRQDSDLEMIADATMHLHAGQEPSKAVTSSMIHSLLGLHLLTDWLTGQARPLAETADRAAAAIELLLDTRDTWLATMAGLLDSPDGVHFITPARRSASASQSALVIRETSRRPSTACEAADWAHTDVYLTLNKDYRAVLLGRNPYADALFEWTQPRKRSVISFGAQESRAQYSLRFPHDDNQLVAPLVDTLLAELVGQRWFHSN